MAGDRKSYSEKLRDPRWQKRRLEILTRDEWACRLCRRTERTLTVHHRWYTRGQEPWEATDRQLVTLCEPCHSDETKLRPMGEEVLLTVLRQEGWLWYDLCRMAAAIRERIFEFETNRPQEDFQEDGVVLSFFQEDEKP